VRLKTPHPPPVAEHVAEEALRRVYARTKAVWFFVELLGGYVELPVEFVVGGV